MDTGHVVGLQLDHPQVDGGDGVVDVADQQPERDPVGLVQRIRGDRPQSLVE
jgi:hypothetical protein